MKLIQAMPLLMLVESAVATGISAYSKDWFGVVYWFGCVVIYFSLVVLK